MELLHEEAISQENYRIVGKVAADLLGPDCLLLFHPESGGLMLPGPDSTAQLRGDTPLEVGDAAEHIWIEVESIAGTVVRGQLGNNPVNLDGLSMGSPVNVEASAIEDWVFHRDGEPEGLFSVPELMAMRAERAGLTSSLIH